MATIRHGGWPDLGVWSYVLLAILVATEGPITTLIGAAAAAAGYLDVWYVLFAAAIGNVTGDSLWYTIGYVSKLQTIYRYGRWLGLRNHHIDRIALEMQSHAAKLIVLSKISYGLMVPTLVAAGLARVSWRRWLPTVLVTEMIWTVILVTIGFHGAGAIAKVGHSLRIIGLVVFVLLMLTIFWYVRRIFRRSAHEDDPEVSNVPSLPVTDNEYVRKTTSVYGEHANSESSVRRNNLNGAASEVKARRENLRKDNFQVFPHSSPHASLSNEVCREIVKPAASANFEGVKTPTR